MTNLCVSEAEIMYKHDGAWKKSNPPHSTALEIYTAIANYIIKT